MGTIYINEAGRNQMVLDEKSKKYIGHVWRDTENEHMFGRPCWNINNGVTYLWGYETKTEAVEALLGHKTGANDDSK